MTLYRRPKFLEILHEIREEMSREVDYDVDLFAETARTGKKQKQDQNEKKSYTETESVSFENFAKTDIIHPETKM
jgi:hypothetical protein